MEEKILTLHPTEGKSGVNINKEKYDLVRAAILEALRAVDDMTFKDLTQSVHVKLKDRFDGSIPWYVTTVKLDLEARGTIARLPKTSPQRLRLVGNQTDPQR
jgi:hypothetical protein